MKDSVLSLDHRLFGTSRAYRSVFDRLTDLSQADLFGETDGKDLSAFFANYYARLGEQAQRADTPTTIEALRIQTATLSALWALSAICNPDIFIPTVGLSVGLDQLSKPALDLRHPLHQLALFTQTLAPGQAYLRGAEQITQKLGLYGAESKVAVFEWHFSYAVQNRTFKDEVARIPIILDQDEEFLKTILTKVIDTICHVETPVEMKIWYAPPDSMYKGSLIDNVSRQHPVSWAHGYFHSQLDENIMTAQLEALGYSGLSFQDSQFYSLSLSSGQISKTWNAMIEKGFFGKLIPQLELWKKWSLQNTFNMVARISSQNMLREAYLFLEEMLMTNEFQQNANRKYDLIHIPVQMVASHSQTIVQAIKNQILLRAGV